MEKLVAVPAARTVETAPEWGVTIKERQIERNRDMKEKIEA